MGSCPHSNNILPFMRGLSGFIFEALLPGLVAGLFAFGIFVAIRKSWRQRHEWAERPPARARDVCQEILSLAAFLLIIAVMLAVACSRFQLHYELWTLQSQNVQQIQIGNHTFTDESSIDMVVRVLKSSEWYSVNHGGWGDETPMVITMRSGPRWYMQVGYHFTHHGAVIGRSSAPRGSGWNYGQVFSVLLPVTLEKLGVPLSHCDTAHGHPCAAQPPRLK